MPKDRPPTYTPTPELPADPEIRKRFAEIIAILAETQTVSGAARNLDLSRNHMQSMLHKVIVAILEELTPKPAGRPAKPAREAELEAENARLKAELAAVQERSAMIERMMEVVGGIASGKVSLPRSRAKKTKPEDPEPAPHPIVTTMREHAVPTELCARILGVSSSTVRRLKGPCSTTRAARARELVASSCAHVRSIVRATHGLVGAASLARSTGVSRRNCAEIKRREVRELELERKARCASVVLHAPNVMRGFDAMHVDCLEGKAYWLVAADAAVPYRTSIATTASYDAASVVAALRKDFETHGPPLVLRLDRIACQRTPEVDELLKDYFVLALHGPPRHPYYYGQLERQNREHRAWHRLLPPVTLSELAVAACDMRTALNALWLRPTLNRCTAEHAWQQRQRVEVDRLELRREVDGHATKLLAAGAKPLTARRISIESALTNRGLLTINQGHGAR
jgi:transposase InsO family protein/molybdenum-dependent DNA-binding transcriptional regulator ModE